MVESCRELALSALDAYRSRSYPKDSTPLSFIPANDVMFGHWIFQGSNPVAVHGASALKMH